MSGIGPELPPHLLAKRKRREEDEAGNETKDSSDAKRSVSPAEGEKRRRVVGPVLPPAPLDERPEEPPHATTLSDSDDDDEFGPALPPAHGTKTSTDERDDGLAVTGVNHDSAPMQETLRRDEWMMMPPKQDDLAARLDPTKQRPRAFNTSKGAHGVIAPGDDGSAWHETPEQKKKRLADEMMGVSQPSPVGVEKAPKGSGKAVDRATTEKIREHTNKTRGPSLLDRHQNTKDREPEDDPSARAFDRDKDMGSGMRIGHSQRKELLTKSANFSSKFAGGNYL